MHKGYIGQIKSADDLYDLPDHLSGESISAKMLKYFVHEYIPGNSEYCCMDGQNYRVSFALKYGVFSGLGIQRISSRNGVVPLLYQN